MTLFPKFIATFALAGLATASLAVTPEKGAVLGTDAVAITTALAEDGYKVTRFTHAPALIQVTAIKNGQRRLILISARDGTVIRSGSGAVSSKGTPPSTTLRTTLPANLADKLATQGYDLLRVKRGDNEFEAYAMRNGRLWELKLDPVSGHILRIEAED